MVLAPAHRAAAAAVRAGLVDDLALAAAPAAGRGGGEHAHGRLPPHLHLTGAVAVRADLRAWCRPRSRCRGRWRRSRSRSTVTSFSQPKAASSKLMATRQADALAPLGGVGVASAGRRRSRRRRSCRKYHPDRRSQSRRHSRPRRLRRRRSWGPRPAKPNWS